MLVGLIIDLRIYEYLQRCSHKKAAADVSFMMLKSS